MIDIKKTLRNTKITLNKEDLRQINNKLTYISLHTNKIDDEREEIKNRIKEIKQILDSYEENK